MRYALIIGVLAALIWTAPASSYLQVRPKSDSLQHRLESQTENLKHAKYVAKHGGGKHQYWAKKAVVWLTRELNETKAALKPKVSSAWAWYLTSTTQCVTNHEGGWTSVNPAGYYGRFQMDVSFQNETAYGRSAYQRWGTADHWPPSVQVQHAYSIWSYAGWSRWPTYYRYCS